MTRGAAKRSPAGRAGPEAPHCSSSTTQCPPTGTKCLQLPPAPMGLPLTGTIPRCVGGLRHPSALTCPIPTAALCLIARHPGGHSSPAGAGPDHDGHDPEKWVWGRATHRAVAFASGPSLKLSSAPSQSPAWCCRVRTVPTGGCGAGTVGQQGSNVGAVVGSAGQRWCVGGYRGPCGAVTMTGGAAMGHVGLRQWPWGAAMGHAGSCSAPRGAVRGYHGTWG